MKRPIYTQVDQSLHIICMLLLYPQTLRFPHYSWYKSNRLGGTECAVVLLVLPQDSKNIQYAFSICVGQ